MKTHTELPFWMHANNDEGVHAHAHEQVMKTRMMQQARNAEAERDGALQAAHAKARVCMHVHTLLCWSARICTRTCARAHAHTHASARMHERTNTYTCTNA